jgi:sugar phosphate isomerase/epimerase
MTNYSRREIGMLALAVGAGSKMFAAAKPNSKVNGVQIGMNVPYNFGGPSMPAEEVIAKTIECGGSGLECRTQPIEIFLGTPAPQPPPRTAGGGFGTRGGEGGRQGTMGAPGGGAPERGAQVAAGAPGGGQTPGEATGRGRGGRAPLTPEQQAAQAAAAAVLRKWRLSRSIAQFKSARKLFDDAGVAIEILKVDWIQNASDDEVEYCFQMAKNVGAYAISCEIPLSKTKWLGAFADKHKMMVGYHGHTNVTDPESFGKPESWETAMTYAKYNGINLDIGHFVAANSTSPIPFLQKHHDRITHIHVKDRKMNNGPNTPFGQGETPVKEVLQLMRDKKWKFQATIEFEYPVPQGSDRMAEIKKSVEFCRAALLAKS